MPDTHDKQARMDAAEEFAQHFTRTRFEDLPAYTIANTKRSILDTLGVATGASGIMPEVKALADLVKEGGGKPESTIWGFGGRVPSWMAAFVNGGMVHSLDFDDVYDDNGVHPSASAVPAVMALAERTGSVSGRDMIAAVALANDMIARVAQCVVYKRDWFLSPALGGMTGAMACSRALGLTTAQTVDALGIAFCQAAGTMEIVYGTDSNIRAMYQSFSGKVAVLSALMAQRGISGVKDSLEGQNGLFNVYFAGKYDRSKLMADLGRRFEGDMVSFKAWPFCRRAHPAVTAVIELLKKQTVAPDSISQIIVDTNAASHPLCVPPESRVEPKTLLDAKFSIPYTVATAMYKQWVGLEDFTEEAIRNPQMTKLAAKVVSRHNPAYEGMRGMTPGRVEIHTLDGKVYTQETEHPYGHPGNPITHEDTVRKFRECAGKAAVPVQPVDMDRIIDRVANLEKLKDVGEIARLLGPAA